MIRLTADWISLVCRRQVIGPDRVTRAYEDCTTALLMNQVMLVFTLFSLFGLYGLSLSSLAVSLFCDSSVPAVVSVGADVLNR